MRTTFMISMLSMALLGGAACKNAEEKAESKFEKAQENVQEQREDIRDEMPRRSECKRSSALLLAKGEESTTKPLEMSAAAAAAADAAAAVGDAEPSVGDKEDTSSAVATMASPRRPLPRQRRRQRRTVFVVAAAATVGMVLVMGTVLTDMKATGGGELVPSGFLLGWTTAEARKNATAMALRMSRFDADDDVAATRRRLAREANEFVVRTTPAPCSRRNSG